MSHAFSSVDSDAAACIRCGAHYSNARVDAGHYGPCSGRTDLIHTEDLHNTGHVLDCTELQDLQVTDPYAVCSHIPMDCDCDTCDASAMVSRCDECGNPIDYCTGHGDSTDEDEHGPALYHSGYVRSGGTVFVPLALDIL